MATQQLAKGQRVSLSGLAVSPDYNERQAVLESWDETVHRWVVVLDDDEKFKVKPENLEALPPKPEATVSATESSDSGAGRTPATSAPAPALGAREPEREPEVPVHEVANSKGCMRLEVANAERSDADGVTYFSIVVSLPESSASHSVERRYNDILSFRNELAANQSLGDSELEAPFPKKALFCKGQRLEERRRLLELWLQKQLPQVQSFDGLDARWCTFLRIDAEVAAQ